MLCHVCILDENPIPLITPLVDPSIPSDGVIFAYQKQHTDSLTHLKQQMKGRGLVVHEWALPDSALVSEHKLSFLELIEQFADHELWLNASSGDRHINLAAYEVFRLYTYSVFCLDPKTDVVSWIYPDNRALREVSDTIKVKHYLEAYGAREVTHISHKGIASAELEMTLGWVKHNHDYQRAIRSLNFLASSANNEKLTSDRLNFEQLSSKALNWIIEDLGKLGYCELRKDRLIFKNEQYRFFANGGWLENYVFGLVRKLRKSLPTLQDDAYSVEVERVVSGGTIRNELDVAFLANNRLHIIECKTKHFAYGEGNALIYKLDSLVDTLGGLHARGMVVSYLPITKSEKRRAKDLGIEVIDFDNIQSLESRLMNWIKSS
mgnify:CR=1 FL=1